MRITLEELKVIVAEVINEVKKKKKKEKMDEESCLSYVIDPKLDFSAPLGAYNLYKSQGAVNWGPMTGQGSKVDDRVGSKKSVTEEHVLRLYLRNIISESIGVNDIDNFVNESFDVSPFNGMWEAAAHWYGVDTHLLDEKRKTKKKKIKNSKKPSFIRSKK
jgi:hypothetical protein